MPVPEITTLSDAPIDEVRSALFALFAGGVDTIPAPLPEVAGATDDEWEKLAPPLYVVGQAGDAVERSIEGSGVWEIPCYFLLVQRIDEIPATADRREANVRCMLGVRMRESEPDVAERSPLAVRLNEVAAAAMPDPIPLHVFDVLDVVPSRPDDMGGQRALEYRFTVLAART